MPRYKSKPSKLSLPYKRKRAQKRGSNKKARSYKYQPKTVVAKKPMLEVALKKDLIQTSQHNDLSRVRLRTAWMGKFHKINKGAGRMNYRHINQWVASGIQGRQVVDFPEVVLTRNQLIGTTSNARSERYRWDTDPQEMNPYVAADNTAVYPTITGNPVQDKLYIEEVRSDLQMLSMSTLPQQACLYFVTPIYDTENDPVTFFSNLMNDKGLSQPAATTAGTIATTTVSAGVGTHLDVGANPWAHREFRRNWRCVAKHKVILQPGDQHNISMTFKYGTYVDLGSLFRTRTQQFLSNISVFPMLIGNAGLQGIAVDAGTEAAEVAYGKCKIGMVHNINVTFRAPPANRLDIERVYKGVIEASTETAKQIDDIDDVETVEQL
jgi:hypothetical protein